MSDTPRGQSRKQVRSREALGAPAARCHTRLATTLKQQGDIVQASVGNLVVACRSALPKPTECAQRPQMRDMVVKDCCVLSPKRSKSTLQARCAHPLHRAGLRRPAHRRCMLARRSVPAAGNGSLNARNSQEGCRHARASWVAHPCHAASGLVCPGSGRLRWRGGCGDTIFPERWIALGERHRRWRHDLVCRHRHGWSRRVDHPGEHDRPIRSNRDPQRIREHRVCCPGCQRLQRLTFGRHLHDRPRDGRLHCQRHLRTERGAAVWRADFGQRRRRCVCTHGQRTGPGLWR